MTRIIRELVMGLAALWLAATAVLAVALLTVPEEVPPEVFHTDGDA